MGRGQDFTMLFIALDVGPLLDRLEAARAMLREREWTEGETCDFCRTCGGLIPKDWDRRAAEVGTADGTWAEVIRRDYLAKPRGHADDCALAAFLAAGSDAPVPDVPMPEVPCE